MWNKKKIMALMSSFVLMFILMVGCSNSNKETKMTDFLSKLESSTGYDVKYIEDRKTIRVIDYLTKETISEVASKDSGYDQWVNMRNTFLDLYKKVEKLGASDGVKNISYELIIIDKDSANSSEEVPLLIVNETGIVFDIVEEIKNK